MHAFLGPQSEDGSGQDVLRSQPCRDLAVQIKDESAEIDTSIRIEVLDMPQDFGLKELSIFQFSISKIPKCAYTKVMESKR